MNELLKNLNSEDIVNYKIVKLAEHEEDIKLTLFNLLSDMDTDEVKTILIKSESILLCDLAIDLFAKSVSYNNAYHNGRNFLVKYSKYFNNISLERFFSDILSVNYRRNQILNAGGMEKILNEVYSVTKLNIANNKEYWKKFFSRVVDDGYNLDYELLPALVEDGVVIEQPIS